MENLRKIKKIVTGRHAVDGAGVHLVRVFGNYDTKDFDPFLLLDAFDSKDPNDYIKGFPWHPHRGIETITYLIQGDIEHGDSLGNKGSILNGDCQWMTAGSGIIHQEMPKTSDRMLGAQIWLNLPAKEKMCNPIYGDIAHEQVPCIKNESSSVKIIAGEYQGNKGGFQGKYVDATYLDVDIKPNESWEFVNQEDYTLFIYIFAGSCSFDPNQDSKMTENLTTEKQAVLFTPGEKFYAKAGNEGIRFILLSAKPLNEPVAWGGPIVMNTREELELAFFELDNNTFIKHK